METLAKLPAQRDWRLLQLGNMGYGPRKKENDGQKIMEILRQ